MHSTQGSSKSDSKPSKPPMEPKPKSDNNKVNETWWQIIMTGESEEEYDPYKHREKGPKTSSNFESLINCVKGAMGTGILAMPFAFKNAGYANGAICFLAIGFVCAYGIQTLIRCQYKLCQRKRVPYLTYAESMEEALKIGPKFLKPCIKRAQLIVNIIVVMHQLGICCVYYLFVGRHVHSVIVLSTKKPFSLTIVLVSVSVPFILISLITNLKVLVPFSIQGNFFTFIAFAIVLSDIFYSLPKITTRDLYKPINVFPTFLATSMFALESTGVIITVEKHMETPESFTKPMGILNISMSIVVAAYAFVGFTGYWKYGEEALGSITLNLPETNEEYLVAKMLYCLAIFVSYPLQMYGAIEVLWNVFVLPKVSHRKHLIGWEMLIRTVSVISTGLVACFVTKISIVISLVGSTCLTVLGLIFPALMDICLNWGTGPRKIKFLIFRNVLVMLFGFTCMIVGTATTLSSLIRQYINSGI